MNINEIIRELDCLNVSGKEAEGVTYLEDRLREAQLSKDPAAELSVISELLGQYRRCSLKEKGLESCFRAIELVKCSNMENTPAGATILINAATTMKAFGRAEEAVPIFEACEQVYLNKLAINDYRISALYNNMALAYEDVKEYPKAEDCFKKALSFLEDKEETECDRAVTCCSLAELFHIAGRGEDAVNEYMEKAWELFVKARKDGYFSFSVGKCLQAFDYFGFFLYAKKLRELKEETDELYR